MDRLSFLGTRGYEHSSKAECQSTGCSKSPPLSTEVGACHSPEMPFTLWAWVSSSMPTGEKCAAEHPSRSRGLTVSGSQRFVGLFHLFFSFAVLGFASQALYYWATRPALVTETANFLPRPPKQLVVEAQVTRLGLESFLTGLDHLPLDHLLWTSVNRSSHSVWRHSQKSELVYRRAC